MQKGSAELVFILDKSGSMAGLEKDTIGGFNAMLDKQKAMEGECRITTVLFSSSSYLLHDRIDIRAISPLTTKEYAVGGGTALLDTIGGAIEKTVSVQKNTAEAYRAGRKHPLCTKSETDCPYPGNPSRLVYWEPFVCLPALKRLSCLLFGQHDSYRGQCVKADLAPAGLPAALPFAAERMGTVTQPGLRRVGLGAFSTRRRRSRA